MERRLHDFAELVATAISNAANRSELIASRARIVAAGDEARRRIERNLHDGTQQRLIALGLDLQHVRATIPEDPRGADAELAQIEEDAGSILDEVRELSRGLHPPLLSRRGLAPALSALAQACAMPVELQVKLDERPPETIETAVYYVISEALTNAVRYSQASQVSVSVAIELNAEQSARGIGANRAATHLHATIADDGVGGADPSVGSGLTGLRDRAEALGGQFALNSPPRHGTTISVALPLGSPDERRASAIGRTRH
jgi:signal transduction histidine kinase